jgi:hypothetical protein
VDVVAGDLHRKLGWHQDLDRIRHFVEVTAESLYEAAILGMTTMKVSDWRNARNLKIEVRVKAPETTHTLWNSVLPAWLARNAKTPKGQPLKTRLRELIRS